MRLRGLANFTYRAFALLWVWIWLILHFGGHSLYALNYRGFRKDPPLFKDFFFSRSTLNELIHDCQSANKKKWFAGETLSHNCQTLKSALSRRWKNVKREREREKKHYYYLLSFLFIVQYNAAHMVLSQSWEMWEIWINLSGRQLISLSLSLGMQPRQAVGTLRSYNHIAMFIKRLQPLRLL